MHSSLVPWTHISKWKAGRHLDSQSYIHQSPLASVKSCSSSEQWTCENCMLAQCQGVCRGSLQYALDHTEAQVLVCTYQFLSISLKIGVTRSSHQLCLEAGAVKKSENESQTDSHDSPQQKGTCVIHSVREQI